MASSSAETPTRKTSRRLKPSLKALESLYISKLKNSGFVKTLSSDEELYFTDEEEYSNIDIEKPKLLHDNDLIHGEEIFKFQTRKQKNSLAQKVAEATRDREAFDPKTPHAVRSKTRTRIAKLLEENSESEYEISSESDSDEIESDPSEKSSSESSDSSEKSDKRNVNLNVQLNKNRTRNKGKYLIKTDEYFENASNKIKTSDNTLDKLETPRLPQYQLQKLMRNVRLSKEHRKCLNRLTETNRNCFKKWLYLLHENFNILLYGLGSKRSILNDFQSECLKDFPVIVVNGFFPTLTGKSVLDSIIDLLELNDNSGNLNEACDLIVDEFSRLSDTRLYLIVHNIEGETIRNAKVQSVLARLASVKNIHLLASIDHINAPLIWDHYKLSKFNYVWWDVTSFSHYSEETSFERSMMVQQTGSLALSSLRNVFLSLTTNSKSIYLIIVKHQLENGKNQYYQGLPFKNLYMACREAFIVSSDLALRAQLTEFVDHKMIKLKRSADGTEYLLIPLANALLHKFLEENS